MVPSESVLIFLSGIMIILCTIQFIVGYYLGYIRAKKELEKEKGRTKRPFRFIRFFHKDKEVAGG